VLITVALATGLRAAELADLNVGDLYEMSGTWWLDVRHGKGNKRRRVEIAEEDAALIIEYVASTKRNFAAAADRALPLWCSRRLRTDEAHERRLTANHIRRIIDSIADLAQARGELAPGKRISPHALRHTYAINLLRGDATEGRRPATIVEVQFRLGHTDLAATKRYVEHLAEEEMIGLVPHISRQIKSVPTDTNNDMDIGK
jgi:integrase